MTDAPVLETTAEPARRSFAGFALMTYGTNLAVALLGFVNVLVIARALGPTGRGSVAFLTTIAYLTAQIFSLGVQQADANFAAREPERTPTITTNSLLLAVVAGGAAIAVLCGVQAVAPAVLGDAPTGLRWLAMGSIPFLILGTCALEIVGAHYDFHISNASWLVTPVLALAINGTLALAGALTVGIAVATWVAGQLLGAAVLVVHLVRRRGGFGRPDLQLLRRQLSFGIKAHIGALLTLTNYRMDQWLMGAMLGPRQLGYYSVAVAWAEALFFLPTTLANVLRPYLVRSTQADAARRAAGVLRIALALTLVTAVVLVLAAPLLCTGIFGAAFAPSVDQLRVLAAGAFGIVALKILGNALTAQGKPLLETLSVCVTTVVVVALNLLLIPSHAGLGAAIASTAGYTGGGIAVGLIFSRQLGLSKRSLFPRVADVRGLVTAIRPMLARVGLGRRGPRFGMQAGPETALFIGAAGAALLVGALFAKSASLAVAALMALLYAPLALINLPLGIALWLPLVFLEGVPVFNLAGKAGGLLIAFSWLGSLRGSREQLVQFVDEHRWLVAALSAYLLWITLSLAWASSASAVGNDLWHWFAVALIFVVVLSAARDESSLRLVMGAFVVGAVLAVVVGLFYTGPPPDDLGSGVNTRFAGAQGDPNILAAGLIPAAVLASAMIASSRDAGRRWLLGGAVVALVAAIAATQSRGGLVASAITVFAALLFFPGRRAWVASALALVVGIAGLAFAASPGAWARVSHFDDGSGRTDIWRVALRVAGDHPITGAGLNNFQVVSGDYVRRPGSLTAVTFLVDRPHVAHSMYLETLAGTGAVGLALLMVFMVSALYAAWLAALRFERIGDADLAVLARAVLVGGIGMMAAAVFISGGVDKRLWVLLALGPALHLLALRRSRAFVEALGPLPAERPPVARRGLVGV